MRFLWIVFLASCSTSNFDVGGSPSTDSGTTPPSDTAATTDTSRADTNVGDGVIGSDSGCVDPQPVPPPCTIANAEPIVQIEVPGTTTPHVLRKSNQIAFQMRIARNGRIGKVTVGMIAASVGGAVVGTVTLQAFLPGCVPKPLAKVTLPFSAQETWAFAFGDIAALPAMNAGERIYFVLSTDSDAWEFVMKAAPTPTPNTHDLSWGLRNGTTGDFTPIPDTVPSITVLSYACGS
jgi:hypothetical protein